MIAVAAAASSVACSSVESQIRASIEEYNIEAPTAEERIDKMLESANGGTNVPLEQWDVSSDGVVQLALEKGMMRFAAGDFEAAESILSRLKEPVNDRRIDSIAEYIGWQGVKGSVDAFVNGDQGDRFRPADYEHLLLYVVLTLSELLANESDSLAYANQFELAQNRVLGSDYGVTEASASTEHQRVAIGSYVGGLLREERNPSNALGSFEQAQKTLPESELIRTSIERVSAITIDENSSGSLHVFYFLGSGPLRDSTEWDIRQSDPLIEIAIRLLAVALEGIQSEIAGKLMTWDDAALTALAQAPVPVPVLVPGQLVPPPPRLKIGGEDSPYGSECMLDLNALAAKDIAAARQRLLTRALIRRGLKAVIARQAGGGGWLTRILNLFLQANERADTRCWGALPAEIYATRTDLVPGLHEVEFGFGTAPVPLLIDPGHPAFAVVHLRRQGGVAQVYIDRHSARTDRPSFAMAKFSSETNQEPQQ